MSPIRASRCRREDSGEGSGTVLTIAVIGLVLIAGVVCALAAGVQTRQVRIQAVADLAALAGGDISAPALWESVGERPCESAGRVATTNGMGLHGCEIVGTDTRVVVTSDLDLGIASVTLSARARAGPHR